MTLLTFDDDQDEIIEFVDSSFFYMFTIVVLYLIYKHSIHYFAFLEASVSEGRSVNFVTVQFVKDFLATFSLMLRFYILLFRMNVYDTLEDFFDSYYIFIGDFDDDEYLNELFLVLVLMSDMAESGLRPVAEMTALDTGVRWLEPNEVGGSTVCVLRTLALHPSTIP